MMKKGIPTNGSQVIFFIHFLFEIHVSTTTATTHPFNKPTQDKNWIRKKKHYKMNNKIGFCSNK
jgi:hypothetical protein